MEGVRQRWPGSLAVFPRLRLPHVLVIVLLISLLLSMNSLALAGHAVDEHSRANSAPVINSASEYDYPPYCIVTPDNQADGFSVELLRAALHTMGRQVRFEIGPWTEVKQKLVDGKVAVLPLVGRTPEREHDFDFTFPYLKMHGTIVVRQDSTGISQLADLQGKELAVLAGDNAEEFLRRSNLGASIVTTATFDEALQQLANGQHDAVVMQKLVALQLMKKLKLNNLKMVGPPLVDFQQNFCFAVKKGDRELLDLLNEGLSIVVADGTFHHLREKWFGPIEALEVTKSRIVIGGDADYPPYEFLDENGQPTGYNVELSRAVARQMGVEVDIQLRPWAQIRTGLAKGEIDAVEGMFYSLERDRSFDFTPAHTLVSHVIAVREGTELPRTLSDLAGKSILVMDGDIMHDAALRQGYEKQLVLVNSQEEALKQLAGGNYDCALVAKIPALYWIKQHGWQNLRLSEQTVHSPEYAFAVPHNQRALLARLSEALAAVEATGEYRDIYARWLGVYEKQSLGAEKILKYVFFIILPIVALLLLSLLWSWSLKGKVKRATTSLDDERQRLASIIEGTGAGTWEWNVQTGATRFNREWAEMIGYRLEEIAPVSIETWKKFAHPDDLQTSNELLAAHFRGESEHYECESRIKHKSGDWIWVLDRGKVASWTSDGKPLWMFGTHLNITARKRNEEALRESNERFANAFDLAVLGKALVSPEGKFLQVNPYLCDLLGYSAAELTALNFQDLTHPDDLDLDLSYVRAMLDGKINTYQMKKRYLHKQGRLIWALLSASLVKDLQRQPLYFIAEIQDITAREEAEAEREKLIAQLQDKTAEQERFVYTVSHDLKSPLVTISGFLALLEEDVQAGDEAGFRADIQVITNATQRMKQLLEDLLELSRIGIKKNPAEVVNLGALVEKARDNVAGLIDKFKPEIEVAADLPDILVDSQEFLQVIENLLVNAAKFSADRADGGLIKINMRRVDGLAVCCVADNGIGIEPRYLSKVFDLFETLDPDSGGTGVGLAIVKRIVEVHGGKIWAESDGLGQGASFCFTVPEVNS